MVATLIFPNALNRHEVNRLLNHTQHRLITALVTANDAQIFFTKKKAALAQANLLSSSL
jgi:hypothetical protein